MAQNHSETEALERIVIKCRALSASWSGPGEGTIPLRWVGRDEATREEPDLHVDWDRGGSILASAETGIVNAHSLMLALEGLFTEAGGQVALASPVTAVSPIPSSSPSQTVPGAAGWEVSVAVASAEEETVVTAATVVNAAGLGSADIANMALLSANRLEGRPRFGMRYAKGNYFSYTGAGNGSARVRRLIYPAPVRGAGGLGTHLTLDLAGRMRFGPDVEWVDDPSNLAVNTDRLVPAIREIQRYLPSVQKEDLQPDYCGIRPKLVMLPHSELGKDDNSLGARQERQQQRYNKQHSGGSVGDGPGFVDFVIRREPGLVNWVNCLGIESPGLTSSLAVGEMVRSLVYEKI